MASSNPIYSGFVTAFRQPALVAGEVTWRSAFRLAALALAAVAFAGFLDALVVTNRDLLALGSGDEDLIAWSLAHIFEDAEPHLLRALAALVPAIVLLWIVAASWGRAAILSAVVEGSGKLRWRSIFVLHVLQAALAVATAIVVLGVMIFASRIAIRPDSDSLASPDPGLYLVILVVAIPPVFLLWRILNWLLSLATICVARSGAGVAAGMAAAVGILQAEKGRFLGVAALFGVLRWVAIGGLFFGLLFVLGALARAGANATLAALLVLALLYFVAADFLRVARLVADVEISQPAPPAPKMLSETIKEPPAPLPDLPLQPETALPE
jgi:hypothetical protein